MTIPRPLVQGWLGTIVFLQLSDDRTVDPDVAIRMTGHMSALAQELDPDERLEFISAIREVASEERHPDNRSAMLEIAEFLEEAGLEDDQ
jgi:hypothetical protein